MINAFYFFERHTKREHRAQAHVKPAFTRFMRV